MKRLSIVVLLLSAFQFARAQDNYLVDYRAVGSNPSNQYNGSVFALVPRKGSDNTFLGVGVSSGSGTDLFSGDKNTAVGTFAAYNITTGSRNSYIGYDVGYNNKTGTDNVMLGASAGAGPTLRTASFNVFVGEEAGFLAEANNNVFLGYQAGRNATGDNNTLVGYQSGYQVQSEGNAFLGYQAGYNTSTGNNNAFFGYKAGLANTDGKFNTFLGALAGFDARGTANTFVGNLAGTKNVADYNTFIGQSAGQANTTGAGNTFLGQSAGTLNTSGNQNTFVGQGAGLLNNGSANTFLGYRAGHDNTSGQFNTFTGVQAGQSNTTGSSNYFFGTNSGFSNTTGSGNYFLGDNAGGGNTTGGFNVYIGANAGNGAGVNGDNNLAIGFESGRANVSGANNLFLGFRADAGASRLSNATAIGNGAKVNISNALILGSGANVGIGTSSPTSKLHVVSGTANQSGLRLENLTSASPASTTNQSKFLSVDASGNVILASSNSSARHVASENLWQQTGRYTQTVRTDGVIIGQRIGQTPAGYQLYVQEGILTEKVKVAIKDTDQWSDKVFAPTYTLQPLAQVERYIRHHQHLPGVPSAEEIVKQGVDVGQMDAKLLEKIEELTLYVIAQQKELAVLRQQVTNVTKAIKH